MAVFPPSSQRAWGYNSESHWQAPTQDSDSESRSARPEISKIEFCCPIYDPSGWDGGRVPMVDFQVLV